MSDLENILDKFLDACNSLNIALKPNIHDRAYPEALNNDLSILEKVLIDHCSQEVRSHCKRLLNTTHSPDWHLIRMRGLGCQVFDEDVYSVASSSQGALAFLLERLDLFHIPAILKDRLDGVLSVSVAGDEVAQIIPASTLLSSGRVSDDSRYVKALTKVVEGDLNARIAERLRKLRGLENPAIRYDRKDRTDDWTPVHLTLSNIVHSLREGLRKLSTEPVSLSQAQKVLCKLVGAGNWHHLIAAEKKGFAVEAPYALSINEEDDPTLHSIHGDLSQALKAYSQLLYREKSPAYYFSFIQAYLTTDVDEAASTSYDLFQLEDNTVKGPMEAWACELLTILEATDKDQKWVTIDPVQRYLDSEEPLVNPTITCPKCEYLYAPNLPEDVDAHISYHLELLKSVEATALNRG